MNISNQTGNDKHFGIIIGLNVCYSIVKYKVDGMHFWKGCSPYAVCIGFEKLNTQDCYQPNPPLSCHYCCLGNYCNTYGLGNRTHILTYLVTFTLNSKMTSDLRDTSSQQYRTFKNNVANELKSAIQDSPLAKGSFYIDITQISDPYITVKSVIECTTIVENYPITIFNHISYSLNSLSTVNGIPIKAGSIFIGLSGSDKCTKDTTSSNKGTYEWPETWTGNVISLPCVVQRNSNDKLYAKRKCGSTSIWDTPDTSACPDISSTTVELTGLSSQPVTDNNADDVSSKLVELSKSSETYTDNDMNMTVYLLEELEKLSSTYNSRQRADNIANSISNLLDSPVDIFASSEQKSQSPTRLQNVVNALSDNINVNGGDYSIVTPNLAMFAVKSQVADFEGMKLKVDVQAGSQFQEARVTLMKGGTQDNTEDSASSIVIPNTLFESQQRAERMTFAAYATDKIFSGIEKAYGKGGKVTSDEDGSEFITKVNSQVISARVPGVIIEDLKDPIFITFSHHEKKAEDPVCVFWDKGSTSVQSRWSTRGCVLNKTLENSHTVCACDHLTNFALLMDVYGIGGGLDDANKMALSYISYIGCGISLLGLILTLITYFSFRKLRKNNPSKILINLCLALTATDLIFLLGMQSYTLQSVIACKVVAILMHYFLLAAMCWMAVEAFYMYLALVKVFNTYIAKFLLKSCLVGWGVPLVVVAITLGVNSTNNYGKQAGDICWLQPIPFYAAFLAPVGIILILNFIAFALVMKQLFGVTEKKLTKSDRSKTSSRLRGAVSVVVLLGLTWVFAIFSLDGAGIIFTYLFAIFNSLQGLFIFVFYCLFKKDAKRAWLSRLCPGSYDKDSQTTRDYSSKSFSDITKDTDDVSNISTRGSDAKLNSQNGTTAKERGRYPSYTDSNI